MRAPEIARRAVATFQMRLPDNAFETARLLVGELVTNSLIHACMNGEEIEIELKLTGRSLYACVANPGSGFEPPAEDPDPEADAGRGLVLLRELSDDWGVEGEGQTTVWFELHERWWTEAS